MKCLLASFLLVTGAANLGAQAQKPPSDPSKAPSGEEKSKNIDPTELFGSFSVGLAMFSLSKREVVTAIIENGVVRVTEERAFRAGPWLQANYLGKRPGGFGFFVGVEVSGEAKLIRSVGIGPLFQFTSADGKKAINLGIGAHWTSIQRLGPGLFENEHVPAGTESIRYKIETHPGIMACVSFGF